MIEIKNDDAYALEKIIEFDEMIKRISEIKSANKTIGLCHGGFDLLHPGHVKHFESAKQLCDVLVVSITSDKYVSSRKGSGRPVFSDKIRAYMAANIGCVDYAVISDFKKGVDVIKLLKPSFYIKGPDFIHKTTPGITAEREAIKDAGGEMKYTNDPKLSTTEIINYIKNRLDNKPMLVVIDRDGTLIKNNDFFGKNEGWKQEMELNAEVISFISYLQTKYNTTKIVVTNQSGVARRFFTCETVEKINEFLNSELSGKGIKINNWQYCPYADSTYALKNPEFNMDSNYVQGRTKRKPNTNMVFDALKELDKQVGDFDKILVIGDRDDDKGLAENLKAGFIDVNNKNYDELKKEARL